MGAVIVVAVIFRLIGNAVYKHKVKKAIELARQQAAENSGGVLQAYGIDAETREKMVQTAKKAMPVIALVTLTVVVAKAVKKASDKKKMEEMRAYRYYYYH